jgi:FtsP/CotA-like multicopper oxidase with cupredoxin domain
MSTSATVGYTPVVTPNGVTLPFRIVDGVKIFHLIAEPVENEFAPGLTAHCWGYNGRTTGPTIEAVEGDHVRIYVTNKLPVPTTVHWHGLHVPNGMDGVNGVTQPNIDPGQTFRYEFTLTQSGTFMYHPHFDEMTQQAMGMMGMFVIHPQPGSSREDEPVDRDFAIMLAEWRIDPGTYRPLTTEMTDFNVLTMNSKAFPATEPLVVKRGQRVRIRLANLSAMDHHPIHLHGFDPVVTFADGTYIPKAARWGQNTVLVPVGSTRQWEFVADAPGDWVMHCHMTHHVMNQMGHNGVNMIGAKTADLNRIVRGVVPAYMTMGQNGMGDMASMRMEYPKNSIPMLGGTGRFGTVDMGGMFTIVKVRDDLSSYADPGNYEFPAGTVAAEAAPDDLKRDGVSL